MPVFGFRTWGIPARTPAAYGELEWTVLGEVPGAWQGVKGFCSVAVEGKNKKINQELMRRDGGQASRRPVLRLEMERSQ